MKNKHLVLLFFATICIGLAMKHCDFSHGKSLDGPFFDCDTTRLVEFSYAPHGAENLEISFFRSGKTWFCTQNGHTISPENGFLHELLAALAGSKIRRLVAKNRSAWSEFGVTDEQGTRLIFEKSGAASRSFVVGFSKKNEAGAATTFARMTSGEEVFELDDSLADLFQKPFNSLKNNVLCDFETNQVVALAFNYPNRQPVLLDRVEGNWQSPGGSKIARPERLAELFRVLKKLGKGLPFAENFGEMDKSKAFTTRLLVTTNDAEGSFSLTGFRTEGATSFVLNSSQNAENYFFAPDSLALLLFADPLEGSEPNTKR